MKYYYTIFDLGVREIPDRQTGEGLVDGILSRLGVTVLDKLGVNYPGVENAYTVVWVLAESHAVLHTAPESNWIEVVFAFCKKIHYGTLQGEVIRAFRPKHLESRLVEGKPPMRYSTEHTENSKFQEIKLVRFTDEGDRLGLLLDGAIQFVEGPDEAIYHHTMATMPARMMAGRPFDALILGGGDGLAARNLLKFPNARSVTMVELDDQVLDLFSTKPELMCLNGNVFSNPRLHVVNGDARSFLAAPRRRSYDIAVVDFPDPLDSSLEDLYSEGFYRSLADRMDGFGYVIAVQSSSFGGSLSGKVAKRLKKITGRSVLEVPFMGDIMGDSVAIFAGPGLSPVQGWTPPEYRQWVDEEAARRRSYGYMLPGKRIVW